MKTLPTARTEGIVLQSVGSETLVYELATQQFFLLNESLQKVFQACDGRTTFEELRQEHGLSEDEVLLALQELDLHGLLDPSKPGPSTTGRVSRRDLLLRLGKGSIALPLLSVLAAPLPAAAASAVNLPLYASCTNNSQCAPTNPVCASRLSPSGPPRCCAGSISYYDPGTAVNSCSGGSCSAATFSCQSNANDFCCSNSATASCTGNSCACRCN